jgi:hypothetical protein
MEVNCKHCGKRFNGEKRSKFCTRSCSASHNNKGVCRNPKKERGTCLSCDTQLTKPKPNKFCSNDCANTHKWLTKRVPIIEAGLCTTSQTVKKYLLIHRGEVCQLCGQLPIWHGKPLTLQIDHIDGNSDNNRLDNVRILCPHCHTQTSTFVSRNIKKDTRRNNYLRKYKQQRKEDSLD